MNWTGGHLQHHSKTNSSAVLRAQRQHFVKARLQQQNGRPAPSPMRLSNSKMPVHGSDKVDCGHSHGVKRKRSSELRASGSPHIKLRCSEPVAPVSIEHTSGRLQRQGQIPERNSTATSKSRRDKDKECRKSVHAGRDSLDAVKRSLLRRSDWLGLTAARPLHMKFPSTEELENIGRRRKMTSKDKKWLQSTQTGNYHCSTPNPESLHCRPQQQSHELQGESASIRIGPNIHRSQTTTKRSQPRKSASLTYQSESSHSMLLDKESLQCGQSINAGTSPRNRLAASLGSDEEPRRSRVHTSLLSLGQVRDSESFDAVKAKSDSISKQNARNQGKPSLGSPERTLAKRTLPSDDGKSSSIVVGWRLLQSTPSGSEGTELQTQPRGQTPRQTHKRNGLKRVPQNLSSGFLQNDGGSPLNGERRCGTFSFTKERLNSSYFPGLAGSLASGVASETGESKLLMRPQFTLELQAQAEAQAAEAQAAKAQAAEAQAAEADAPILINHHRSGRCSEHAKTTLFPKSDSYPVEDDTSKTLRTADVVRKEQESSLVTKPPTLAAAMHPDKLAQEITVKHPESLRSPGWTSRPQFIAGKIPTSPAMLSEGKDLADRVSLSQFNPMRQRFQYSDPHWNGRRRIAASRRKSQTGMQSLLQNDRFAVHNNYNCGIHGSRKAQDVQSPPRDWPKHHQRLGENLNQSRQLGSPEPGIQYDFGPAQGIKTIANPNIHEAEHDAKSAAFGQFTKSRTGILSQLSPVEGQLNERLVNASLYNNPARTEQSYAAGSGEVAAAHEGGNIPSDHHWQLCSDAYGSSPRCSTYDRCSSPRAPMVYDSPVSLSPSATCTTAHHVADRKPFKPIPNLFAEPRPSSFNSLQKPSDSFKKSIPSPSMIVHVPEKEVSRGGWIQPPVFAHRRTSSPLNIDDTMHPTVKNAQRKHWREYQTPDRLGGHAQSGIVNEGPNHISHSGISSYLPSFSKTPITHPDTGHFRNGFINLTSVPNSIGSTTQEQNQVLPSIGRINRPSPNSCNGTPLQPVGQSPNHPTSGNLGPLMAVKPTVTQPPAPPHRSQGPMPRPLTPLKPQAFNTPRPMRKNVGQITPHQATAPFSTPRPVRSVLGEFKRPQHQIGVMDWGLVMGKGQG